MWLRWLGVLVVALLVLQTVHAGSAPTATGGPIEWLSVHDGSARSSEMLPTGTIVHATVWTENDRLLNISSPSRYMPSFDLALPADVVAIHGRHDYHHADVLRNEVVAAVTVQEGAGFRILLTDLAGNGTHWFPLHDARGAVETFDAPPGVQVVRGYGTLSSTVTGTTGRGGGATLVLVGGTQNGVTSVDVYGVRNGSQIHLVELDAQAGHAPISSQQLTFVGSPVVRFEEDVADWSFAVGVGWPDVWPRGSTRLYASTTLNPSEVVFEQPGLGDSVGFGSAFVPAHWYSVELPIEIPLLSGRDEFAAFITDAAWEGQAGSKGRIHYVHHDGENQWGHIETWQLPPGVGAIHGRPYFAHLTVGQHPTQSVCTRMVVAGELTNGDAALFGFDGLFHEDPRRGVHLKAGQLRTIWTAHSEGPLLDWSSTLDWSWRRLPRESFSLEEPALPLIDVRAPAGYGALGYAEPYTCGGVAGGDDGKSDATAGETTRNRTLTPYDGEPWFGYPPSNRTRNNQSFEASPAFARDSDRDGVADYADNCPGTVNLDQADVNRNGVGDACETIRAMQRAEPSTHADAPPPCGNATADLDWDGTPDVCDWDADGDGVRDDGLDNCPRDPNPLQRDADGDGRGDVCEDSVEKRAASREPRAAFLAQDEAPAAAKDVPGPLLGITMLVLGLLAMRYKPPSTRNTWPVM